MPLRDDILAPIPGGNPAGVHLKYDHSALYEEIREARREDVPGPRRPDEPPPKKADWSKALKLLDEALATRSKDLELAGWAAEALTNREGFTGLRTGLQLVRNMLQYFWDALYPPITAANDSPLADRAARLDWVGLYLVPSVQRVPLTTSGFSYIQYVETRDVGSEDSTAGSETARKSRQQKLEEGKLPLEEWDKTVAATSKDFYRDLIAEISAARTALEELEALSNELLPDDSPNYSPLRDALDETLRLARSIREKKLETDPDPVVESPGDDGAHDTAAFGGDASSSQAGIALAAEPRSTEEAASRVGALARFLRQAQPTNPGPYLMLRGLRWGELRACGPDLDPRLLVATPTAVRHQLKALLLDQKWRELLELCESVMARPEGRGWLDLQRYAVTGCESLGAEYDQVARAIRGELALLLREIPQLTEMALMDDAPTANEETRQWLHDEGLLTAAPVVEGAPAGATSEPTPVRRQSRDYSAGRSVADVPFERAQDAVRGGQPRRAIEILMHEVSRERSPRARFVRRTQIATIMVDAGMDTLAKPILEDLIAQMEKHELDGWESGEMVSLPLALLYRCLRKLAEDEPRRQELYLRICRLDPLQAMSLDT